MQLCSWSVGTSGASDNAQKFCKLCFYKSSYHYGFEQNWFCPVLKTSVEMVGNAEIADFVETLGFSVFFFQVDEVSKHCF